MNKNLRKIHEAWKEVKAYQKMLGDNFTGTKIPRYRDFKNSIISATLGKKRADMTNYGIEKAFRKIRFTKQDLKEYKWGIRFKTEYTTSKAEYQSYRRLVDEGKIKDSHLSRMKIAKMNTRDFADLIKEDIKSHYKELIKSGKDSYEAKKEISSFYFGS